jgi:dienelactone hydrolase
MRLRFKAASLAAFALLAAAMLASSWALAARAQESVTVEDRRLSVRLDHRSFSLIARVLRPAGEGPFPLVVINHGTPAGDLARLRKAELGSLGVGARWFAAHGFVVVVVLRPGFGESDGPFMEASTPCANRDYVRDGHQTADIEAAIVESAKALPGVDPRRVVVVGHSTGGFGAITLADSPPPGVLGVINFAGGKGGDGQGHICSGVARLVQAGAVLGRANRLPQLWLYAPNDRVFPPSVAHPLYDAYRAGSKPSVRFVDLPPFGDDGHMAFIQADPDVWAPSVLAFLREIGASGR